MPLHGYFTSYIECKYIQFALDYSTKKKKKISYFSRDAPRASPNKSFQIIFGIYQIVEQVTSQHI